MSLASYESMAREFLQENTQYIPDVYPVVSRGRIEVALAAPAVEAFIRWAMAKGKYCPEKGREFLAKWRAKCKERDWCCVVTLCKPDPRQSEHDLGDPVG